MVIVERLKRWSELARLRRAVRRRVSPASLGELAEKLIALGERDEALRTANEGLALFPDSERLAHVRGFALKARLSGEIRRLKEELARRPNPLTYSQLAQVYLELGSHDDALELAAECAERFPLNEASYLVQGEIRAERFRRDLVARDAVLAEAALSKVVRLNSHNVAARMHLAELHWLVGDAAECRTHLAEMLEAAPSAAEVRKFLAEIDARPGSREAATSSFEMLAEAVEANRAFANDVSRFPAPQARAAARAAQRTTVDADRARSAMVVLGGNVGMKNAVLLDQDGASVADFQGQGGLAAGRFVELVTNVRDVADDASRRMDAGALVRVDIEGPGGSVAVARARGLTVAVLYAAPLRVERACEAVEEFVARAVAAPRSHARA